VWSVDDILAIWGNLGAGGKRGLAKEKRGPSNIKAASHISLQNRRTIQADIHKEPQGASRGARPTGSIDNLWQPWWLTLRKTILGVSHKYHRKL